ncbi:hypothetical protein PCC79_13245 [Propioniciclava soli]|uniref:Uncharacterized protein n=1 Tax=Propioniciclava soli TaxID=2775081 RepID=A0ABZ3CC73_9ACTN
MNTPTLTTHEIPGRDELVKLYRSVGWEAYTRDPDRLHAAVGRRCGWCAPASATTSSAWPGWWGTA